MQPVKPFVLLALAAALMSFGSLPGRLSVPSEDRLVRSAKSTIEDRLESIPGCAEAAPGVLAIVRSGVNVRPADLARPPFNAPQYMGMVFYEMPGEVFIDHNVFAWPDQDLLAEVILHELRHLAFFKETADRGGPYSHEENERVAIDVVAACFPERSQPQ